MPPTTIGPLDDAEPLVVALGVAAVVLAPDVGLVELLALVELLELLQAPASRADVTSGTASRSAIAHLGLCMPYSLGQPSARPGRSRDRIFFKHRKGCSYSR
jgi:hypothetical protein